MILKFRKLPISAFLHLHVASRTSVPVWMSSGPQRCLVHFQPNHSNNIREWKSIDTKSAFRIYTDKFLVISLNISYAVKAYMSLAPFWRDVLPVRVGYSEMPMYEDFGSMLICVPFHCYKYGKTVR